MGGRGSTGIGGTGKSKPLSLPTLSGSEKQVAWANDILTTPYEIMGKRVVNYTKQAETFEKGGKGWGDKERLIAAAYKAAQSRYAAEVSGLAKSFPGGMRASQIIDKQSALRTLANKIIEDEYKKRGFKAFEAGKV